MAKVGVGAGAGAGEGMRHFPVPVSGLRSQPSHTIFPSFLFSPLALAPALSHIHYASFAFAVARPLPSPAPHRQLRLTCRENLFLALHCEFLEKIQASLLVLRLRPFFISHESQADKVFSRP